MEKGVGEEGEWTIMKLRNKRANEGAVQSDLFSDGGLC